jgi:lipopolysaccharide biosynthesis glycosyltransferase
VLTTNTGKLQPFSLTEYKRVVQLDSDMLVLQNMDELMTLPLDSATRVFAASHACVCNPTKKLHYPKDWIPTNCAFTSQHENPDSQDMGLGILNGGLVVAEPSMDTYNAIIATIQTPDKTSSYDFADQSLLSDAFAGRWVPLSYRYNALKTMRWCHAPLWKDEEVKNVHYIMAPKPWEDKENTDPTHAWWWEANEKRIVSEKERGVADGW